MWDHELHRAQQSRLQGQNSLMSQNRNRCRKGWTEDTLRQTFVVCCFTGSLKCGSTHVITIQRCPTMNNFNKTMHQRPLTGTALNTSLSTTGTSEVALNSGSNSYIDVASQDDMKKLFKQMQELSKRQKKVEDQQEKIIKLLEASNPKPVQKSIYKKDIKALFHKWYVMVSKIPKPLNAEKKVQYREVWHQHEQDLELSVMIDSSEKWQMDLFRHWRAEELRKLRGQGIWKDLKHKTTSVVTDKVLAGMKVPPDSRQDLHLHLNREIALERQYLKEEKEQERQRWKFWEGYYLWRIENGFIEMDDDRWEKVMQVDGQEYTSEE